MHVRQSRSASDLNVMALEWDVLYVYSAQTLSDVVDISGSLLFLESHRSC